MVAAFVLALAGTAWMQFLTSATLCRICRKEWRESLSLTEIQPRPYLISIFKPRVTIQALPFAFGLALCALAAAFGIGPIFAESDRLDKFLNGLGMIYALVSMQLCGLCAGLLGLLGRLRSLCKPKGSDQYLFLTSLKWLFIVLFTPLLAVVGGFYVEIAAISGSDGVEIFGPALALYLLVSSSILNLIFCYWLTVSWRKAQDGFFKFE